MSLSTLIELRRQRRGLNMLGSGTESDDNNLLQPVERATTFPFAGEHLCFSHFHSGLTGVSKLETPESFGE